MANETTEPRLLVDVIERSYEELSPDNEELFIEMYRALTPMRESGRLASVVEDIKIGLQQIGLLEAVLSANLDTTMNAIKDFYMASYKKSELCERAHKITFVLLQRDNEPFNLEELFTLKRTFDFKNRTAVDRLLRTYVGLVGNLYRSTTINYKGDCALDHLARQSTAITNRIAHGVYVGHLIISVRDLQRRIQECECSKSDMECGEIAANDYLPFRQHGLKFPNEMTLKHAFDLMLEKYKSLFILLTKVCHKRHAEYNDARYYERRSYENVYMFNVSPSKIW